MEQNLPIVAKRIWSIVRIAYFMLRKSISKKKLLLDLNIMVKRGKIAGKAISNLAAIFHHHHHSHGGESHLGYEFSCSNSPAFHGLFNKRGRHNNLNPSAWSHAPPCPDEPHDLSTLNAVLEMLNNNNNSKVEASPALPGFGRTPRVRRLRITDSPFPVKEADEDSGVVDRAAEEFIKKFYRQLEQQKSISMS